MPAPNPPRFLEHAARYAPPLILLVVGLFQVAFAGFEGGLLTPSKGGGFGLFSTVDKLGNRDLRFYLIDAAGEEQPWNSRAFRRRSRRILQRASSFPTPSHLRAVAEGAAAAITTRTTPTVEKLRIEVHKKSFDAASREARRIEVARYLLELDAEP